MFDIKLSPSKLAYYEACPVFWQEPMQKSEAAEEGDRLHEAVEKRDLSLLDDPEQKEAASQCLTYIRQLAPNIGGPGNMLQVDTVYEEMWLESDIGKKGRADLIILPAVDRKLAHLVDFKFGKQPVEHAATNAQGVDYAYRVFRKFPDIERVQVHFIMPRQKDVTFHEFTREVDFPKMRDRILKIHQAVNDPFKKPTPNLDKACQYCSLKGRCPALSENAVSLARRFDLLPVPEDFAPHAPRTPEERGLAQELADLLIKWGEEVKSLNTKAVLDGAEADGFRVQTRRGNTSVSDSVSFAKEICQKFDMSLEDLVEKAGTISFSKTVTMVKDQNKELDSVEIRSKLENDLGHLLKTGPQINFLARERKGKRKEVQEKQKKENESGKKLLEEIQNNQP